MTDTDREEEYKPITHWLNELARSAPLAMKYDDATRSARGIVQDAVAEISRLNERVEELERELHPLVTAARCALQCTRCVEGMLHYDDGSSRSCPVCAQARAALNTKDG